MKTKLIAVLTMSIFLLTCSFAMAAVSPGIFINGNDLAAENSAIAEDDTTLVPLRAVFEALGQEVEWDAEDKSITSNGIRLQIDNPVATVDGENVNLAVPAKIINNVTYVPLQFIAVSLNKNVAFDSEQNRIDITDEPVVDEEIDEEVDEEVDEEAVADEDVATDEDADVDEDAAAEEDVDVDENVNVDEDENAGEDADVDENADVDEDVAADQDADDVDENADADEDTDAEEVVEE